MRDTQLSELKDLVRPATQSVVRVASLSPQGTLRLFLEMPGVDDPRSAFRLSIFTVTWRLDASERVVVASEDPEGYVRDAVQVLVGQSLNACDIESPSMDSTFHFDGMRLRVFPVYYGDNKDSVYWTLVAPGTGMIVVGPGEAWHVREPKQP